MEGRTPFREPVKADGRQVKGGHAFGMPFIKPCFAFRCANHEGAQNQYASQIRKDPPVRSGGSPEEVVASYPTATKPGSRGRPIAAA